MIFKLPDMTCRAKRMDNHEWVEGFYVERVVNDEVEHYIIPNNALDCIAISDEVMLQKMVRVNRVTLGLSSRTTDIDGDKIFTGDIIETTVGPNSPYTTKLKGLVLYDEETDWFYADGEYELEYEEFGICRIIGNMFDDKELMDEIAENVGLDE